MRVGRWLKRLVMFADLRRDTVAAWGGRVSKFSIDTLKARAGVMRDDGAAKLEADGMPRDRHRHEFTLDVRYVGQSFTLPIRWDPVDADWTPLRTAFDTRHEETFGYADSADDIEIVNVRLVSVGEVDKPVVEFSSAGVVRRMARDPRHRSRPPRRRLDDVEGTGAGDTAVGIELGGARSPLASEDIGLHFIDLDLRMEIMHSKCTISTFIGG